MTLSYRGSRRASRREKKERPRDVTRSEVFSQALELERNKVFLVHLHTANWSIELPVIKTAKTKPHIIVRFELKGIQSVSIEADQRYLTGSMKLSIDTSGRAWPYSFQALVFLVFQARFFPFTFKRKILVWSGKNYFARQDSCDLAFLADSVYSWHSCLVLCILAIRSDS